MDWSGLGVLAVLLVACIGYLSRQVHRLEDRMEARFNTVDSRFAAMDARFDRLEERYIRHLEQHAG